MKMKRKKSHRPNDNTELFDKTYEFKNNHSWQMPKEVFECNKWQIPSLQAKKIELNGVKEQLSKFDLAVWSQHTKKRDPSTQIIKTIRTRFKPELLTQAWCKFYECLSRINLISNAAKTCGQLNSLHLCEAPGGFIAALNHYLHIRYPKIKLFWQASTLNPEYEGNATNRMIPDDRLIAFTKECWLFGADHTGDIMKYYNHISIIELAIERAQDKMDLITADGSVNCMDNPGEQETHVEHLHYCEVITALSVLKTGGNFVIKIFTTFEDSTVSLLYLLNCAFTSVTIVKPATSKGGNSETYVLCEQFKGLQVLTTIWPQLLEYYKQPDKNKSLFKLAHINEQFLEQIDECAEYFKRLQIRTIQENIRYFGQDSPKYNHFLYKRNNEIAHEFLHLYPIYPMENCQQLVRETLRFSKVIHFKTNNIFQYYRHETCTKIELQFVYGKQLREVLYSKYVQDDLKLKQHREHKNVHNEMSLYNLSKKKLFHCIVIDCEEFSHMKTQSTLHHEFLQCILTSLVSLSLNNSNSDILIVNLHLITNFLVGLINILSHNFTIYFFKYSLLYLSRNEENGKVLDTLKEVSNAIGNLPKLEQYQFEWDILEIVPSALFNDQFVRCVQFYNAYLC